MIRGWLGLRCANQTAGRSFSVSSWYGAVSVLACSARRVAQKNYGITMQIRFCLTRNGKLSFIHLVVASWTYWSRLLRLHRLLRATVGCFWLLTRNDKFSHLAVRVDCPLRAVLRPLLNCSNDWSLVFKSSALAFTTTHGDCMFMLLVAAARKPLHVGTIDHDSGWLTWSEILFLSFLCKLVGRP